MEELAIVRRMSLLPKATSTTLAAFATRSAGAAGLARPSGPPIAGTASGGAVARSPSFAESSREVRRRVAGQDWSGRLVGGRYAIEHPLGRGGSATVYRARDTRDNSVVAVKVLHEEFSGSRHAERFAIEIRLLREFAHPNIVPVLDAGESEGRPYYVMPYIDGESLQERLRRERRLPLDDVSRLCQALCDALGYAHDRDVVHRDVKPANIMLAGGQVYLTDFGVAKALRPLPGQPHSTTGTVRGTMAYMSPEQAAADRELDRRSDIFSLGCVLYEAIAGQHPWQSADESRVLAMRFTEPPDPMRRHRDGVPPALERVVMRALQREPADRWQSARAMREALVGERRQRAGRSLVERAAIALAVVATVASAVTALAFRTRGGSTSVGTVQSPMDALGVGPVAIVSADVAPRDVSAEARGATRARIARAAELSLARMQGLELRSVDASEVSTNAREGPLRRVALRDAATKEGVSQLILVQVDSIRAGERMSASLLDVSRDSSVSLATVEMPADGAVDADSAGRVVARAFLRRRGESFVPDDVDGTTQFVALREFQVATRHLNAWSLDSAAAHLRQATAIDPRYGTASLWLGQVLYWLQDSTDAALTAVRRAEPMLAQGSAALRHATALRALLEHRYDVACQAFEAMLQEDSLSFTNWRDVGDCRGDDDAVVPDASSPSRWRFRSSWNDAFAAYQRAIALAPAHPARELLYARAADLLITEGGQWRPGNSVGDPPEAFGALPSLVGGVVHLYPFSESMHRASASGTVPSSLTQALQSQRKDLMVLVNTWARQFPESWAARSRLAAVLEQLGEIGDGRTEFTSALAEARRARKLARSESDRVRMANSEVRLLLKSSDYAAVARLADSLLDAPRASTPTIAALLAPLAALRGRSALAVRLLQESWREEENGYAPGLRLLSADLRAALARVKVATALGTCGRELDVANADVERLVAVQVDSASRGEWRKTFLSAIWSWQSPCTGGRSAQRIGSTTELLPRMQSALVRRDTAAIRTMWTQLKKVRLGAAPDSYSIDTMYQEAWVFADCGFDREAAEHLDLVLAAIPSGSPQLTLKVEQSAALVRALRLRGELYARERNAEASTRLQRQALALSPPIAPPDTAAGGAVRN